VEDPWIEVGSPQNRKRAFSPKLATSRFGKRRKAAPLVDWPIGSDLLPVSLEFPFACLASDWSYDPAVDFLLRPEFCFFVCGRLFDSVVMRSVSGVGLTEKSPPF
jgi:hypothetical protein